MMRVIVISTVLLVLIMLTLQSPRIGKLCPEFDKLKEEFADMCIGIKCKRNKLLSSNFTFEMKKGLEGLHKRFHKVQTCSSKCKSGSAALPVSMETLLLMYPLCCEQRICINTLGILHTLRTSNEYLNDS